MDALAAGANMEDVRVRVDTGTGNKLNAALVIVCGIAALVSSLLSFLYVPFP